VREQLLRRLIADGLLHGDAAAPRTTRRWQGAMARAALRLLLAGDHGDDLRIPIASALLEIYGDSFDNNEFADAIAVLLPIELAELGYRAPDEVTP
jgi:hypothetical protein